MKLILIWASVFLASTALATLLLYDNGHVAMVWGDWVIETSLSFAIGAMLLAFIVIYFAIRLLMTIWNLPTAWRKRRRIKRYNRAEKAMATGMMALEHGDWHRAEKQLIKSAKHSEAGLVHYLSAAKMAHNQNAFDRCEQYLTQARAEYPEEYLTIGLVESRLLVERQPEIALTILETLHEQNPKHKTIFAEYVLRLRELKQWSTLEALLPRIKQSRVLDRAEYANIEIAIWAGKLAKATSEEALEALWVPLTNRQKLTPEILAEYVEQRLGWQQELGLEQLLEKGLKAQWNDRLVYQYGRLTLGPAFERLKRAEKWLSQHPENPVLLLSIGRLACASRMWGLGQSYLKKSLSLHPEIETFHALAQCYEAEGEVDQAALTYKEAIMQLEEEKQR